MTRNPEYLGDGVYITLHAGRYILTTGNHDPKIADNVIVLEPEVLNALLVWLNIRKP